MDGLENLRPDGGMNAFVFRNDCRFHFDDLGHALH